MLPSDTGMNPATSAALVSSGEKSPSGPTRIVASVVAGCARSTSRIGCAPRASEAMSLSPEIFEVSAIHVSNATAGEISGSVSCPHCLHASSATRVHFSDLPSPGCTIVWRVTSGSMPATPSSTAFCTIKSIVLPFGIACASVMRGCAGAEETTSEISSETRSRETSSTFAEARRPWPSKTVIASPALPRSTCERCRASSPVRAAACQSSGGR